jgi:hypothetical protein
VYVVYSIYDLRKGGTCSEIEKLRLCYHFKADNERSTMEFESMLQCLSGLLGMVEKETRFHRGEILNATIGGRQNIL